MRHLASIKRIRELHDIEGADNILPAVIDGFDVVVKKGEFKVGDLCVYCECNSILPKNNPNFAPAYDNLGNVAMLDGDLDQAEKYYLQGRKKKQ